MNNKERGNIFRFCNVCSLVACTREVMGIKSILEWDEEKIRSKEVDKSEQRNGVIAGGM